MTNTELSNIDSSSLTGVSTASETASIELGSVSTSATEVSGNIKSTGGSAKEMGNEIHNASTSSIEGLQALAGAAAAVGGYLVLDNLIGAAGAYEDSWSRMTVALGGTVDTIGMLKDDWSSAISSMSNATGRGAGTVREFITQMTIAGVESKDVISSAFEGIAGAAYVTGIDINTITYALQRATRTGLLNQRTLTSLGLSTNDIMKATGKSIDEIGAEFENMTPTARAAFLGMIYNAKYGTDANEAFKLSWQGVSEALNRAKGYLAIVFGQLILPLAVPATQALTGFLKELSSTITSLDPVSRGLLGAIIILGGGFVMIGGVIATLLGLYKALGISKALDATATWLGVEADTAKTGATTRAIVGEVGRRVATLASTVATGAQTVATYVATTALTLYNNAIWGTSAAYAKDVISKAASVAATIAQTAVTTAATAAQWLLNAATYAFPGVWIVIAIAALVAGLYLLYQNNEQVRASVDGLWKQLEGFGSYISTGFIDMINATLQPFKNVINEIKNYGTGLYSAGKNWINDLTRGIKDSMPELNTILEKISNYFPKSPAKEGPLSEVTPEGMYNYGKSLGGNLGVSFKDELIKNLKGLALFTPYAAFAMDDYKEKTTYNLDAIGKKAKEVGDTAKTAINDSIEAQKTKFKELADAAKQAYQDAASAASDAFSQLNSDLSALGISMPGKTVSKFQSYKDLYRARSDNLKAQRALKEAYDAGGVSKAEFDKQMRSLKEQAKQLNDPSLFASIAQSGKSIGQAWGSGIASGIASSTENINRAIQAGSGMMTAHSPPKEGPLMEIDKWGLSIGRTFAESISLGIGSVSDLISPVSSLPLPSASSVFNSMSTGGITVQFTGDIHIPEGSDPKEVGREFGSGAGEGFVSTIMGQANNAGVSIPNQMR